MHIPPTGAWRAAVIFLLLCLTACASGRGGVQPFDPDRVVLSPGAAELTSERKASAALAGSKAAKDSELICERRPQPGTHMYEVYCFTRAEWMRERRGGR